MPPAESLRLYVPPVTVSPEIVVAAVLLTRNTRTDPPPLTVSWFAPGPVIVSGTALLRNSAPPLALVSVIVDLAGRLKLIVSVPLVSPLAILSACRRLQSPGEKPEHSPAVGPLSAVVFTVYVAACAFAAKATVASRASATIATRCRARCAVVPPCPMPTYLCLRRVVGALARYLRPARTTTLT